MHQFKELQQLAPKYAKQLRKTVKALAAIQDNENPELEEELITRYEKEKAVTEEMSNRFSELIEINKKS
jgi:hypothetical protein